MDGTIPTIHSKTYTAPILITKTSTLKLRSILPQGKISAVRTIHLTKTKPLAAIAVSNLQKGLIMQFTTQGIYQNVSQLLTVKDWKDTIVNNENDFFNLVPDEQPGGGAIFTGYVLIDKNDMYQMKCLADQLFIDNKLIINNDGIIKKNASTAISLPLKAGYHAIKVILINRTYRGVASSWVDASLFIQPYGTAGNESVQAAQTFHK
jgi:hexosaminidase